jgi:hypothetical protein
MRKRREVNGTPNPPTDAAEPTETKERTSDSDFFRQLQQIPPEAWQSGYKVYVYRTLPVIDRRDTEHFLCKVNEAFDEDYLMRNFGSGKYYMRLNNGSGETIASKTVALHNPAFPPKVSPDEVVQTDPRNETYFKVWGPKGPTAATAEPVATTTAVQELSKLASKVLDQRADAPPQQGDAISDATTALLLGMSKGRDELAEKLATLASGSGADPITALDRAVELIKKLQPENGRTAAPDPLAALDRAVDLVKKLQPAALAQPQKNPAEQVTEMVDLYSKLKDNFGSGGAADGAGNLASVAAIVHEVSELLKTPVAIAMQMWAASRARTAPGGQPGFPQQQQPPAGPQVHPEANGNPPTAMPQGDGQTFLQFVEQITPTMIAKLEAGAPGSDFAGWIYEGWPDVLVRLQTLSHPSLPGLSGAPVIIQFYRSSAHWPRIALHEARFAEFIAEFCKWKPEDDDEPHDSKAVDLETEGDSEIERID